jgi:uncharacterized protein YdaU (DUF1376 family)
MANQAPAFQFFPRDFVADVQHMSAEQVGAYMLILCAAWNSERPGHLPNDPEILAPIGKLDTKGWKRCEKALMRSLKVTEDGAWVYSKRMVEVWQEHEAYRASASEAGKKGAAARWGGHSEAMTTASEPHANANAKSMAKNDSALCDLHTAKVKESLPPAPARVMGFDEQQQWLKAWESSNLPGAPLLVSVIAEWRRTPEAQRPTPEVTCLAYKVLVDQQRRDGLTPNPSPVHMLRSWGTVIDTARGAIVAREKTKARAGERRFNDGIGAQPETKEE